MCLKSRRLNVLGMATTGGSLPIGVCKDHRRIRKCFANLGKKVSRIEASCVIYRLTLVASHNSFKRITDFAAGVQVCYYGELVSMISPACCSDRLNSESYH